MSASEAPASSAPAPSERARHRGHGRRVGTAVVVAVGLLFALVTAAVLSGRYQIRPVLSGSMRPGLSVGGVVVSQRVPLDDVHPRDVLVFTRPNDPSELVVHRVISLTRHGSVLTVKTQGDANDAPDPWTLQLHGTYAYRAVFSLPLLGYPAVWFQNLGGARLLLLIAGLVIAVAAVRMWRRDRKQEAGDVEGEDEVTHPVSAA